jgi:HlyD family secretion protein
MKRRTKVIAGVLVALGLVAAVSVAVRSDNGEPAEETRTVAVARGNVVEKAMAVGTIEPGTEVEVKSKVSGVVRKLFTEAGVFVEAGAPLVEIRPDPTPLELVDARRQLELRDIELETNARELERQRALRAAGVITETELERTVRQQEQLTLQATMAREKLSLLEGGRITVGDRPLESVVTAPISGYVLERITQIGEMVVPLGSFQSGTVLFKMADMNNLVFRGTVDEIDVGRLKAGAEVTILVGALPDVRMTGRVTRISLRSRRQDQASQGGGSVGFPVEIAITDLNGAQLRAGYSASAEITVRRADDVLLVPERVITYAGDTATVMLQRAGGVGERRVIQIGVSDAVNVQVVSGLKEGERVLERPGTPTTPPGRM